MIGPRDCIQPFSRLRSKPKSAPSKDSSTCVALNLVGAFMASSPKVSGETFRCDVPLTDALLLLKQHPGDYQLTLLGGSVLCATQPGFWLGTGPTVGGGRGIGAGCGSAGLPGVTLPSGMTWPGRSRGSRGALGRRLPGDGIPSNTRCRSSSESSALGSCAR